MVNMSHISGNTENTDRAFKMLEASSFMFATLYERGENKDSNSTKRRAAVARRRATLLTRCPDWEAVENKEMAFDVTGTLLAHRLSGHEDMLKVLHRELGVTPYINFFVCVHVKKLFFYCLLIWIFFALWRWAMCVNNWLVGEELVV